MLEFKRLVSPADAAYSTAIELYKISFPTHEQRAAISQHNVLQNNAYHFELIYDETCFVGLLLFWETTEFIYVEHFCVSPLLRNKRYGQTALALLNQKGKHVILEIDPVVDEISHKRKGFYERAGFVQNPYAHVHPPYHADNDGHELLVMSYPAVLKKQEYDDFQHYLEHTVMSGEVK